MLRTSNTWPPVSVKLPAITGDCTLILLLLLEGQCLSLDISPFIWDTTEAALTWPTTPRFYISDRKSGICTMRKPLAGSRYRTKCLLLRKFSIILSDIPRTSGGRKCLSRKSFSQNLSRLLSSYFKPSTKVERWVLKTQRTKQQNIPPPRAELPCAFPPMQLNITLGS